MDCPHDTITGKEFLSTWHIHDDVLLPVNGTEEGVSIPATSAKTGAITWRTYASIRGPSSTNDLRGSSAVVLAVMVRVAPDASDQRVVWQLNTRGDSSTSVVLLNQNQVEWLSSVSDSLLTHLNDAIKFTHQLGLVQDRKASSMQDIHPYTVPTFVRGDDWTAHLAIDRGLPVIIDPISRAVVPHTQHATVSRFYRDSVTITGPARLSGSLSAQQSGDPKTRMLVRIIERVAPHAKFLRTSMKITEIGNPFKNASFTVNQAQWLAEHLPGLLEQMIASREELRLIGVIQAGEAANMEEARAWLAVKQERTMLDSESAM